MMKTFIEEMRRLVKTPKMPFVIGVLDAGGFQDSTGRTPVVQAQRAAALPGIGNHRPAEPSPGGDVLKIAPQDARSAHVVEEKLAQGQNR